MTIDGEWMMTVAKGGNCEVMSAESSENCVSGLVWTCGCVDLLGLKRTKQACSCHQKIGLHTWWRRTDRERIEKIHDLMTEGVMVGLVWR
jgi:hypothetical protein